MNKLLISIIIILIILIINYKHRVRSMCTMEMYSWDQIHSQLNTGDVFLTRYDHMNDLNIIKYLIANVLYSYTGGMYTHTAVVVRIDDNPYLYTAMDSPKYDLITKTYKAGSMLIDIKDYLLTYNGNFVLYKINQPVVDLDDFNEFIITNSTKQFDPSPITMMNTIFGFWKNKETDKTMCSQAVADALKELGIMSKSVYSPDIGPTDIYNYVENSNKYNDPVMVRNVYTTNQCSG